MRRPAAVTMNHRGETSISKTTAIIHVRVSVCVCVCVYACMRVSMNGYKLINLYHS